MLPAGNMEWEHFGPSIRQQPPARHDVGVTETSWQDPDTVRFLLDQPTWAVVGLSGNPARTAYRIAELLQQRGKRIVPVHPAAPTVLGEQGYATLADVPFPVDVVDVFRRSEAAGDVADQAVAIGATGVWFQLGVVDELAFRRTTQAGVAMVMDTCPAIEWSRR
jgi:predicted CoA-binding protein